MPSSARLSDLWVGICCCHSKPTCIQMAGPIITGSPNDNSGGLAQARLTDMVIGYCGHTGSIVSAASYCNANSLGKARIGDKVVGCVIGNIVTGSPNHIVGDLGGASPNPFSTTYSTVVDGVPVTYTEVDFGNVDDEVVNDDGLNIYPPVIGRSPTPNEIQRSADIDVSPTVEVAEDSTAAPPVLTPPTSCLSAPDPAPSSFVLTPNFTLGRLSSDAIISRNSVYAQASLSYTDIICNLQAWAEQIGEPLVTQYGNIMAITSGFRSGSGSSQHHRGQAADIQFLTYTVEQVYNVAQFIRDNLNFDQMILEYGGNKPWLHISYNREGNRSASASNKFGTRVSAGNYQWGRLIYMT